MTFKVYPTFIGIGGHKCASTWLSECMREHPEVFMSEPKELGFFSWRYDKGIQWYLKYFKSAGDYKERGEFTSHYIYDNLVPERIIESVGQVKLIVVVRDPVKRALSQIKYGIRHRFLDNTNHAEIDLSTLLKMIEQYPEIVTRSYYSEGLREFVSVFGITKVKVIDQEDCSKAPLQVLDCIWHYLDVDNSFIPSRAEKKISKGSVPKWQFLELIRKKIFYFFNRYSPNMITNIRRLRIGELYRKLNSGKAISFERESKRYLEELFESDWNKTKQYIWRPKVKNS